MYRHLRFSVLKILWNKIWWTVVPGTNVIVKWPVGEVVVGPGSRNWSGMGPAQELVMSADPNDHYRPWLEKYVGKQGQDWDWKMLDNDATNNTLTIKFRRGCRHWASIVALKWQ